MVKVTVLYPKTATSRFDLTYYLERHMPMVRERLGAACLKTRVDEGLGGGSPGAPPPYAAIGHMYFESVASFQAAFGPHARDILADIPNYTDVQPLVQVSQVRE
ncbi:MAG: EthD family reductase [Gemmatimonadales bacterium]|nr:EthD family reductase [Gemmatimonadota bacterium]MCC7131170.1 EthD family reductase [Gemmatimonadales bacterium]MDX2060196.1 EthD family reductase [Gemmatimonadales bacterium]